MNNFIITWSIEIDVKAFLQFIAIQIRKKCTLKRICRFISSILTKYGDPISQRKRTCKISDPIRKQMFSSAILIEKIKIKIIIKERITQVHLFFLFILFRKVSLKMLTRKRMFIFSSQKVCFLLVNSVSDLLYCFTTAHSINT